MGLPDQIVFEGRTLTRIDVNLPKALSDRLEFEASCEGLNVQIFGGMLLEAELLRMMPELKEKAARRLAEGESDMAIREACAAILGGEFD